MAAATYSRNPIVNQAISVNSTSTSATLYTAPSDGYAKVDITLFSGTYATSGLTYVVIGTSATSGTVFYVRLAGGVVTSNMPGALDSNGQISAISDGAIATATDVTVGPSQSIYLVRTTSGAQFTIGKAIVSGVEFKNG